MIIFKPPFHHIFHKNYFLQYKLTFHSQKNLPHYNLISQLTQFLKKMDQIDKTQLKNLVMGTFALFLIYCLSGIFHQYLIVLPYYNFVNGEKQVLPDKAILVFVPTLVTYIIGKIYNRNLPIRTKIPQKNSLYCGAIIFISTITYTWATAQTSFPIVMAFKSCNLLAILLVAILCTRVRDKKLNLGKNKLVVGIIISVGVFIFSFFDPEQEERSRQSQFLGIFLLFISLLADGFLPDFQAEIKSDYKPQPTQMMEHINKWVAIISLVSMVGSLTIYSAFLFTISHPLFAFHLVSLSLLSTAGQFVVYTLIKLFKQHIVPFIITTRKILTIVLSILYYSHKTTLIQLFGMVLVFSTVVYQFFTQVKKVDGHPHGSVAESSDKNISGSVPQEFKEEDTVGDINASQEIVHEKEENKGEDKL